MTAQPVGTETSTIQPRVEQVEIVISDLHLSAGPLDDCDQELEARLCEFLRMIGTAGDATELVVNGDFLDFVQAEPWEGPELRASTHEGLRLAFTEEQSLAKLENIFQVHQAVFVAL